MQLSKKMKMKILHTSDWHLGRQLYNQRRTDEFEAFLDWLIKTINGHNVDALLVTGDVFDTTTPSATTQEMYYEFLHRASHSCCRHIVIVGGNHDSPTLLNAPKSLLKNMNIHVVGEMCENLQDEVITLHGKDGKPEVIVCAVPFLRDRDVRTVDANENIEDKAAKLINGIATHYDEVAAIAQKQSLEAGNIPVVATGHLFTTADRSNNGDGVRELYVGTLAHIDGERFPPVFKYVALGHLHIAQTVGKSHHIRYSGSPIPMGFNEANQHKKVVIVEFGVPEIQISEMDIPRFKALHRIEGSAADILEKVKQLKANNEKGWLEVTLNAGDNIPDLPEQIANLLIDTDLVLLSTKNRRAFENAQFTSFTVETLEEMQPNDVFDKCLEAKNVSDELKAELKPCFDEILNHYYNNTTEN